MPMSRPSLICFCILLAIAVTLSCGTPSSQSSMRTPTSVTVSPASADAMNYPKGEVQLTATAVYSQPPSPVTPISVVWDACPQPGSPAPVSVSANGVAQCVSGATGTFTVRATVPPSNANIMCGALMACGSAGTDCAGVHGVAKLTCP